MASPTDKTPEGPKEDLLAGKKPKRIPAASRKPGPAAGTGRTDPARADDRRTPRTYAPRGGAARSDDRRPPRTYAPRGEAPRSDERRPARSFTPRGEAPRPDDRRPPRTYAPRGDAPRSDERRPARSFTSRGEAPRSDDRRTPRTFAPRGDAPRSDDRRTPRTFAPRGDAPRSDERRPARSYAPRGDKPAHAARAPRQGQEYREKAGVTAIPSDRTDRKYEPAASVSASESPVETRVMPEGWIEGRNPVQEALRAGRTINKVWILKPKGKRLDPILSRLAAQAREAGAVVMEVERDALDRMAFSKGHQGVIAQAAAHSYSEWQDFVAAAREKGEEPLVLVLDELKDPYNLGSILRIADAAGVHGVVIPERNSVGLDALTAKASAGAIEHVPVARVVNVVATLEAMKKDGFWITGTAAEAETLYDAADYNGPTALVVGSEGEGLGRLVREHCDFLVGIPMLGKVNSLNVAVATGIVVFEAVRRRRIAKQGV